MLQRAYIQAIAQRGARYLLDSEAVTDAAAETLEHILERAITEELEAEARLREEARTVVAAHSAAARAQGADLVELQEKVVRKLAEERGVVLR